MSYSLKTTVETSGRKPFDTVSAAFRNPEKLMTRIGLFAQEQARSRIRAQVAQGEGISSGRLMASFEVGNPESIFEVNRHSVVVGTNLRYAAQRQFGGTIYPKDGDALAIPLDDKLKRHGIWPRELDPTRDILEFRPTKGTGKPNVFGVLVNPKETVETIDKRGRKRKKQKPVLSGYPAGPLYALAYLVRQEANPFLYWSDADRQVIDREIVPAWLRGR